jgi:hypothetical protein
VVRATQPVVPYVLTSESTFRDAMTYGDSTRLEVLASQRKEADAALAAILHCPQRSVWMELTAMRHPRDRSVPCRTRRSTCARHSRKSLPTCMATTPASTRC